MPELRLLSFGEDPLQESIKIEYQDLSQKDIHDLKLDYVRLKPRRSLTGLRLYKIDLPKQAIDSIELPLSEGSLLFNDQKLDQCWPDGPPPVINVLILVHTPRQSRFGRTSDEIGLLEKKQERNLIHLSKYNSSQWASSSNYATLQKSPDVGILNGRPSDHTGLPIGLYHPIFDRFQSYLPKGDVASSIGEIPAEFYANTEKLLRSSQALYNRETGLEGRDRVVRSALSTLFENDIPSVEQAGGKPNGVISGDNGTICMIIEVKNEIGTGGSDPSIQGAISYTKHWGDEMMGWARRRSCCPSFILAVAGPWICVLGAVMLEQPVVQPLTDFCWIANSPRSQSRFQHLAQMFWALKRSISDLKGYYASLRPEVSRHRFYPHIRHYQDVENTVEFSYVKPLGGTGLLNTVFHARTKMATGQLGKDIVVKFPETYHSHAHRLLSDAGLAPKLLYDGTNVSGAPGLAGRMMVVMEYVEAKDLAAADIGFPAPVRSSVEQAIRILHAHNIVFGDLRPPNILAIEDSNGHIVGGMLVDFDWCGTHEGSRYPGLMNTVEIVWPAGVDRGRVMMKDHDIAMLDALV